MSGISKRKAKAPASALIKPEDVALKPKPPMHAKRPPMASGPGPSSSAIPAKKNRLDFSAAAGPQIPVPKTIMTTAGGALAKPPLDNVGWMEFCRSTVVNFQTFAETLNGAFKEQKANKAAKYIASVFRLFMEKKAGSHKLSIEYHLLTTCAVAIKEHGEKLQNLYLHKCLLNMLSWMKSLTLDRQELISALVTTLAEKQNHLDPYYYTALLHDSLGDRQWIDKSMCIRLVSLLLRPFDTRFPSRETYLSSGADLVIPEVSPDLTVANKFSQTTEELAEPILEVLRKWWAAEPPPRNVLRTMSLFSGIPEVREMAAKRMDNWSQNGKLQRHALELLLFIGCNFGPAFTSDHDKEALACLLKLKCLRSKQVIPVFNAALKDIINRDENNLRMAVFLIISNEFSPQRCPWNTMILQTLFQFDNLRTTKIFAQELSRAVISHEELAKPARLFTRELFRSHIRAEFSYPAFAESYLGLIHEETFSSEHGIQDHVSRSATEVVTMLPFVAMTQQVREAAAIRRAGGGLSTEQQNALAKAEKDLSAYFDVVLRFLQNGRQVFPDYIAYVTAYYRYLFLDKPEYYTSMDQGPTENEFNHACKVFADFRFTDHQFWLIVGEQASNLKQEEIIDLLYDITMRSATPKGPNDLFLDERCLLTFIRSDPNCLPSALVGRVLEVCIYKPSFVYADALVPMFVKSLYWKSWIMMTLWFCIGMPSAAFASVYQEFPMFRLFIHMILTKQYTFPVAFNGKNEAEMAENEKKECEKEIELLVKQENIFESSHGNMGAEVTELTSQLLQTCCLASNQTVRRPPDSFLDKLKTTATECQLVAALCESRDPDLLKDLTDNYGAAKAMPAIQDLLSANGTAVSTLPVLVLLEWIMFHFADENRNRHALAEDQMRLIVRRLNANVEQHPHCLIFILKRLCSANIAERMAAHKALSTILGSTNGDPSNLFDYSRLLSVGCFNSAKSQLAVEVAHAVAFEQDASRISSGVSVILKTMFLENMHEISRAMSQIRCRPPLIPALLNFFDRYTDLCTVKGPWPEKDGTPSLCRMISAVGESRPTKEAVAATLKLLCASGKDRSEARERLMKIWFPVEGLRPVVYHEGKPANIFTEDLKAEMLCAEDERITQVALKDVNGPAAVQLLSSFGLTTFSASQLLEAIDKLSITEVGRGRAQSVRPFIIAYRARGAQGGETFLKSLKQAEEMENRVKEERMEEEVEYIPPPTQDQLFFEEDRVITKAEAIQLLKEITVVESPLLFLCPTRLMRCALENKEIGLACISHFEDNLKFFLANTDAFHEIMMLLSHSADRFEEVSTKVTTLATKLVKGSAVKQQHMGYLRKFCPSFGKKNERKSLGLVKNMTADDILDTLNKTAIVSAAERARLLNAYLEKRTEVIDRTTDSAVLDKQLLSVFAGRNGVDGLVAQIHLRAPAETVIKVLKRLLSNFDIKLNPMLVCEFVGYCCCPEYQFLKNKEQLNVLGRYLAEMVIRDPAHGIKAVALVDKMVDVGGFELLVPICNLLISIERSDQERKTRTRVGSLLEDLHIKFPCVVISEFTNSVTLQGPKWRLNQGDRYCSLLVTNLFESEDNDEIARALDSLTQLLQTHPALVAREFGIMASQLSVILAKDSRDVKSTNRRHTIGLVRQTAVALMPKLQKGDLQYIDTAISLLVAIFEKHVKGSASEVTLSEAIITLCYNYLEHHLESGMEMLAEQGKALDDICALHPDQPFSKAVREQIRSVTGAL